MIQKIVGLSNDSKRSSLELQYSWLLAMDEVYKIASAQQKKLVIFVILLPLIQYITVA